jgi:hypothetical protein
MPSSSPASSAATVFLGGNYVYPGNRFTPSARGDCPVSVQAQEDQATQANVGNTYASFSTAYKLNGVDNVSSGHSLVHEPGTAYGSAPDRDSGHRWHSLRVRRLSIHHRRLWVRRTAYVTESHVCF